MSDKNIIPNSELDQLSANTIRILSAEIVQKAKSGHPGMPMGMADVAYVLWAKHLKINAADPEWINRDRFILSAGHGSALLYSLLYLSGFDITMDELKSFRQLNSRTAGHPEFRQIAGIEVTSGPLGQGFANGVGMAIASKMTASKFNTDGQKLFGSHYIYGIVSDGDLMEGISAEAASIAGSLSLGNIIYFYDDNHITIEGDTDLTFTEDVEKRFESYGWQTIRIDGHNHHQIEQALLQAQADQTRPTLILTRTTIGFGSPNKANTSEVHGSPLGADELVKTKENLGWKYEENFFLPAEVKAVFDARREELVCVYDEWQKAFCSWKDNNPKQAGELEAAINKALPENLEELLFSEELLKDSATRQHSGAVIQKIADLIPYFAGGSADLAPSNNTYMKKYGDIKNGDFTGRNFHFGIREHGMGAIVNGMAYYGGYIPFGATFLVFADYMRGSVRLSALSHLQVIYVFTHDSIFVGEDGPTHQPVEHYAALRSIPGLTVIRPADGLETMAAWITALRSKKVPTAILLSRQKTGVIERNKEFSCAEADKGGYIAYKEKNGSPDIVLISSGSELGVTVKAAKLLEGKYSVRVVSVPSLTLLEKQPKEYIKEIIPENAKVAVIEAASMQGWGDFIRQPLLCLGLKDYGKSAPAELLADYYGFTPEKIAANVAEWLG